ncbi:hypothetical protein AAG906_005312 [Vitis piasezkii]
MDEMDMIGTGRILDAAPHELHSAFDIFGVSAIDSDDGTLYDACTDVMDMIGTGRILDVAPPKPRSAFDAFGISMLEFDNDGFVASDVTHDVFVVEGESDSVDPLLSFDIVSWFVTCFDDVSDGNNDMSIFEYLPVSQHFPLIAPPVPTTHICDVDDVGDTDGPLSGQSDSDSDSDMDDMKVTPISGSTELIDFGASDQPREIRIDSSLSSDERSRLIDLLRSYLDVKEEMQKQLGVGFLLVVEYPEWLANVVHVPKKDGNVRVCVDFRDLNKASLKDNFPLPHIDMQDDSTVGHSMLSFMDGFSGYNKILMAPEDMEKTSFITEWDRANHLAALQRLFERIRQFRLRLNPKKCTFGVTSGKLLGHIVSEQGIEVDLEKIRAILDMLALRTQREIRGFLGRLQYISCFIARLTDICEPIFRLLRKNQPTVWDDDGKKRAIYYLSKRMLEYECRYIMIERLCLALVWATRRLRHYVIEYSILLFDIRYVTQKSVKGSIVADHLASLPVFDDKLIDDDFPDEQFLYFDGAANQSGFGIGILLISPQGDHIPRSIRLTFSDDHWLTNNIVDYEACITGLETALDLGVRQLEIHGIPTWFDELRYIHLPKVENQFVDALATLASMIEIPTGLPRVGSITWYHDIYHFLACGTHPKASTAKDRRALRQLATRFVICGDALYRRSLDGLLLLCLDCASADRVMREVHVGVCGPHMGGHMLAHKIMRTGYFWLTMEIELWGIDIIGKISPKSSNGHEYILVAIDYFTKWEYGIQHHRSSVYRLQTNGAIEAMNKNIKRILRKMVGTSRDWSEKLPFALWAYLLPVEIEMGSLRVALEQHISEVEWAQSRFDQLSLLDERRLRAVDHVQAYKRNLACAFRRRVKPRKFQKGDQVLRALRGLISDLRGKFRPTWSEPYLIRDLTRDGAFTEPINVDQLENFYA